MQKIHKHMLEEPVASTVISHRFSHVVWGAVFAALAVITVTQLTLALLGTSIGFSAHVGDLTPGGIISKQWGPERVYGGSSADAFPFYCGRFGLRAYGRHPP